MGRAKDIVLKVIPATIANPFVKAHHYSGSVVGNSKLHFGVFLDGQLHGVMSYGPSSGMVIERLAVRIRMISARRSFIVTVDHLLSLGSGCMVTAKPEAYFPV